MYRNNIKSLVIRKKYKGYERRKIIDNEIILSQLDHPNILQQEVIKLNSLFNLENFYHDKTKPETAIGIITKKQNVFLECKLIDIDYHAYNCQLLYDALYNPKLDIISLTEEYYWQSKAVDDGNIIVQLTKFGDFLLWLPNKINEYQFSKLVKLNNELNKLKSSVTNNKYLQDMFLYTRALIMENEKEKHSIDLDDNSLDNLINYYIENSEYNITDSNEKNININK